MLVRVTRQDIKNGVPKNNFSCPIAQSLFRAGLHYVSVRSTYVIAGCRTYRLSLAAQEFVRRFDNGIRVKPATFLIKGLSKP